MPDSSVFNSQIDATKVNYVPRSEQNFNKKLHSDAAVREKRSEEGHSKWNYSPFNEAAICMKQ